MDPSRFIFTRRRPVKQLLEKYARLCPRKCEQRGVIAETARRIYLAINELHHIRVPCDFEYANGGELDAIAEAIDAAVTEEVRQYLDR